MAENAILPLILQTSLCANCGERRIVTSGTGSMFLMCQRGLRVASWPKYPPQPVSQCPYFCDSATSAERSQL